tara:strand:+ start:1625 stop:1978 length:354 start_codon:yes stop_codon:yes gene_type:complete
MDAQPINIRTLVHHIEHLVLYSLILWQITLSIWLLLKWVSKNIKFNFNSQPIVVSGGENNNSVETFTEKTKKNMGVIDVEVKKEIFISDADKSDIKMDEVKKGKVKTQKEKLRKLRK